MPNYYLLSATGEDRPGFVAAVTKILFNLNCNLEDSSMTRLGSEFAMIIIFTSRKPLSVRNFAGLKKNNDLSISLKKISDRQARFMASNRDRYIVRLHGHDQPGIVYRVTACLAKHAFNITDLSTHRTTLGRTPGYILLLEGELLKRGRLKDLKTQLERLAERLETRVSIEPVLSQSL